MLSVMSDSASERLTMARERLAMRPPAPAAKPIHMLGAAALMALAAFMLLAAVVLGPGVEGLAPPT
jgi:hypothetical protein